MIPVPGSLVPLNNLFVIVFNFINFGVIPLIFAIAFVTFLLGVYKYFFAAGEKAGDKRKEGRTFVLYGIIGFFLMLSLWGIVNVLMNTLEFAPGSRPQLPLFGPSR